jgi:hypothetical protein
VESTTDSPLSDKGRRIVEAFAQSLRECPEPYRSHRAAGSVWSEGYVAGVLSQPEPAAITNAHLIDLWWATCKDEWALPDELMVKFGRAVLEAVQP